MTNEQKIIATKLGLLKLTERLGNLSEACQVMGYSRDSFYGFKELYAQYGEAGLQEISRKKPNPKNRVEPGVEAAVVAMASDYPAYGQLRASNELKKQGIFVSPGGVRSIWLRHSLETFKKRLQALEKQLEANQSRVLTEAQVAALEKSTQEKDYAIAFRKKIYNTLEELQTDLDQWGEQYNHERTHTGKYCFGRTPLQTFRESKHLAQAKQLNTLLEWQEAKSDLPDNQLSEVVG